MSYLIITYDNSSYIVGDEHIKIVQKHWRDKTPFTLYGGKVSISGGDIRRIEQSGVDGEITNWQQISNHYLSFLDHPKYDSTNSPACALIKRNLVRFKNGEKWCFSEEEEKQRI